MREDRHQVLRALIYHLGGSHQLWKWKCKGRIQSFIKNSLKHKRKITVCLAAWLSPVQRQLTLTWICGLVVHMPSRWSKLLRLEMRKLRPSLVCRQMQALSCFQSNFYMCPSVLFICEQIKRTNTEHKLTWTNMILILAQHCQLKTTIITFIKNVLIYFWWF